MAVSPPAFQFYAQDFYMGTLSMSAAARGCYASMLAASWTNGPIENTPNAIAKAMSWGPSDPPYADLWREVQPKWVLTDAGWINERLERTRREQQDYRDKQAAKGRASAASRAKIEPESNHGSTAVATTVQPRHQPEGQPNTQPEANPSSSPLIFDLQSLTSSSASEVQALSRTERAETVTAVLVTAFDDFWAAYPRKTGKGAASRKWAQIKPPLPAVLEAIKWQRLTPEWTKDGGQFVPHPATWIHQRRWEDEPFNPPQTTTYKPKDQNSPMAVLQRNWHAPTVKLPTHAEMMAEALAEEAQKQDERNRQRELAR
jgi:uncharacterized protein YdaU (DUF1376 family)